MIYTKSFLNEIKDKVKLSSQVEQITNIIPKGQQYIACCPFHHEKTPSFSINDDLGVYYCFGCQTKGDVFSFCSHIKNLTFQESVKYLANIAGLNISLPHKESKQNTKVYNILELATKWFEYCLWETQEGNIARKYLISRMISKQTAHDFRIGFASNTNYIQKQLLSKGFLEQEIINSGLLRKYKNKIYQPFKNRIIFPIYNINDNIVAFGARSLNNKIKPKYLNSPSTNIFCKSKVLYGQLKNNNNSYIIVCEGYMDVITLYQNGFKNTVSTLGTNLTLKQLQILWSKVNNPIICFDGDIAGTKAITQCIKIALPNLQPNKSLKFIQLSNQDDPDIIFTKNKNGKEIFLELIKSAKPLSKILWEQQTKLYFKDGYTIEAFSLFKENLYKLINLIKNPIVKNCYKTIYWKKFEILIQYKSQKNNITTKILPKNNIIPKIYNVNTIRIKILISCLINHPRIIKPNLEKILKFNIPTKWKKLFKSIIDTGRKYNYNIDSILLKKYLIKNNLTKEISEITCENTYIHGRFSSPESSYHQASQGCLEIINFINKNIYNKEKKNKIF